MASSQSQVRFRSSTIHRIVLLAVSLFLLYCLNLEMLYQVYNSPGGDYKLEVRYNFYTIFLYGFAQARPGIVYLKRNDGTIIHKAKISEVGELSDNLITWHDDYVWIYLDKWYYSKSKKIWVRIINTFTEARHFYDCVSIQCPLGEIQENHYCPKQLCIGEHCCTHKHLLSLPKKHDRVWKHPIRKWISHPHTGQSQPTPTTAPAAWSP